MTSLYLIFSLLALLIFCLIVVYSYWKEKQFSDHREKAITDKIDPLLYSEQSVEKSNGTDHKNQKKEVDESISHAAPDFIEKAEQIPSDKPDTVQLPEEVEAEPVSGKPRTEKNSSSVVTELVAKVKNSESIEQHDLLALLRQYDFKFHRKVHLYGLNELTDMWRDIEFELPTARFVELGISIQLADRDGAMSKRELHDFEQMTLAFSNQYDAPFEFSMEAEDTLNQAAILDQIARRYDSMAVLNIIPRTKSGFKVADIESCARDLSMTLDKNGVFLKTKGVRNNLSVLYRLTCTDGAGHFGLDRTKNSPIHDLVIYMNVPATEVPERVFTSMVEDASNLATWLDGRVVDRKGKVMTQRSYSVLTQKISDIAFSMQEDGLMPGDHVCKKLF